MNKNGKAKECLKHPFKYVATFLNSDSFCFNDNYRGEIIARVKMVGARNYQGTLAAIWIDERCVCKRKLSKHKRHI